ncbi:MAG TPA: hypothetical protein VJP78_00990 [Thermoleophilia bacterium]|nr:hypothetical protein [Thermoleophilia bacterium]
MVLTTAIERAGTDPGAVRDEVFGGKFDGATMGGLTYSEAGTAETGEVIKG